MVSAKRIESFDFATMYTNLSLNVVLVNLKTAIKKSFLLSSKRFLKIDIYNKKLHGQITLILQLTWYVKA